MRSRVAAGRRSAAQGRLPWRRSAAHRRAPWRLALALAAAGACAGTTTEIVGVRDVADSSSAPEVTAVVDVGGRDVPAEGNLEPSGSDGVVAVGETLWIHGSSFGRQPTVMVAGQPTAVLARTRGGGILARTPVGAATGLQAVSVSNAAGRGEKMVTVRRYAGLVPPSGGRVAWVDVTADGPGAAGVTEVPGARVVRLSADGRAAYVAGARELDVAVIEVPAPGVPRVVGHVDLGHKPIVALASAVRAPVLAVVRHDDVIVLQTRSPLRPVRTDPRPLPAGVRGADVVAADLSPDGRWLALALASGNRLALLDLARPGRADLVAEVALVPEVRVGVLADAAFSPSGDTVWCVSGDTAESRAIGPQPTRVYAVRVVAGEGGDGHPSLKLARTVAVDAAAEPARLATGRHLPLSSGASIRMPPERATVYLSALVRDGKRAAVFRIGAEDFATELAASPGAVGAADLSPDGRWLLAGTVGGDGGFRVLVAPADGRPGNPRSVELVKAGAAGSSPVPLPSSSSSPPVTVPPSDIRIQP